MNKSANLEMMESRTLLSSAAPAVFVITAQALGSAVAVPFALRDIYARPALDDDLAHHDAEFHSATAFHVEQVTQSINVTIRYYEFNDDDASYVYTGQVQVPMPVDVPPQKAPDPTGSDDSDGRSAGRPSRVSARPAAVPEAAPVNVVVASRDTNPSATVSTAVLHESADVSARTVAHAAGNVISSPFTGMATIAVQGAVQSAKSNMIYLSFLDQGGAGDPILASLAGRLRSAVVSLPAVTLREMGVAVFANGGNVLSNVSPRSFEFAHFTSPMMLVADSVGSFIQASTMVPFTTSPAAMAHRAWMVTAVVLGVDGILLGYYFQKRRKVQAVLAMETALAR